MVLTFTFAVTLLFIGYPRLKATEPFIPSVFSFFKMIFSIPAVPSASYLEEGLVITSTRSMASAGSCVNAFVSPKPAIAEGRPFINIRTFSLPLKLIPPSTSTVTEGTLLSASPTVAPRVVRSFPML